MHILEEDGKLSHKEFLAHPEDFSNGKNPLKLLVEQLKQDFGTDGNIVTYNQSFEVARLNELANMFPEDAPFLKNLVSRVVDLLPVFQGGFFLSLFGRHFRLQLPLFFCHNEQNNLKSSNSLNISRNLKPPSYRKKSSAFAGPRKPNLQYERRIKKTIFLMKNIFIYL